MTLYHFTGIKGSGMSSLAQILHDSSYAVQGSDVEKYFFTEDPLHDRKIQILPFDENNIKAWNDCHCRKCFSRQSSRNHQSPRIGRLK